MLGAEGHGSYKVADGKVIDSTIPNPPACASDRLYLVNMSGLDVFRPLYDALSGMGFYNLNPEAIRDLQSPDPGELLKRDGSNLASVLSNLDSDRKKDVEEYLAAITPGVTGVVAQAMGAKLTLDFRQEVRGAKHPWRFPASNMSDGTLRALGVLVALFQSNGTAMGRCHLIGIEEPESAQHPAAAGVLIDSLTDAAQSAQVIVTTHSADLLDNHAIPASTILAALSEHAETKIGSLDEAGRSALYGRLCTAGELLRMDQLRPNPAHSASHKLELFEHSTPIRQHYRDMKSRPNIGGIQPVNV